MPTPTRAAPIRRSPVASPVPSPGSSLGVAVGDGPTLSEGDGCCVAAGGWGGLSTLDGRIGAASTAVGSGTPNEAK